MNVYLWQSIPSHLHNQFHIFQFSNLHSNHKNEIQRMNNKQNEEEIQDEIDPNIIQNDRNDSSIIHNKKKLSHNGYNNKPFSLYLPFPNCPRFS